MLNLKFDRRKNKSLAQQLLETIQLEIAHHRYGAHSVMPSVEVFADNYHISVDETKWIYHKLLDEKLIAKRKDEYLINDIEIPTIFFNRVHSIAEVIAANHYIPSQKDLNITIVDAPATLLEKYPLTQSQFLRIERIFYGDDQPLMLANIYFPLDVYKDLDKKDIKNKELWPILIDKYDMKVSHADLQFQAKKLSKQQIEQLDTHINFANFIEIFVYNADDQLIEYSEVYAKADEFSFRFDIKIK